MTTKFMYLTRPSNGMVYRQSLQFNKGFKIQRPRVATKSYRIWTYHEMRFTRSLEAVQLEIEQMPWIDYLVQFFAWLQFVRRPRYILTNIITRPLKQLCWCYRRREYVGIIWSSACPTKESVQLPDKFDANDIRMRNKRVIVVFFGMAKTCAGINRT